MIAYFQTNPILIFFIMLFCHIVDDYYLQGILASMKQKSWWKKQEGYSEKYEFDYKIALFMHSFSWAFMINLIFILIQANSIFVMASIVVNCAFHIIIDDAKANQKWICLWTDQTLHMAQMFVTFVLFLYFGEVIIW